jgi:hypothetical protein
MNILTGHEIITPNPFVVCGLILPIRASLQCQIWGTNHLNMVSWGALAQPHSNWCEFEHFFLLTRWSCLTGIANLTQLALLPIAHLAEGYGKNGLSPRRHKLFPLVNTLRYLISYLLHGQSGNSLSPGW